MEILTNPNDRNQTQLRNCKTTKNKNKNLEITLWVKWWWLVVALRVSRPRRRHCRFPHFLGETLTPVYSEVVSPSCSRSYRPSPVNAPRRTTGSTRRLRDVCVPSYVAGDRESHGLAVGRGGGVHEGSPGDGLRSGRLDRPRLLNAGGARRAPSIAGARPAAGFPPVLGKQCSPRLEVRREGPCRQHCSAHAAPRPPLRQVYCDPTPVLSENNELAVSHLFWICADFSALGFSEIILF